MVKIPKEIVGNQKKIKKWTAAVEMMKNLSIFLISDIQLGVKPSENLMNRVKQAHQNLEILTKTYVREDSVMDLLDWLRTLIWCVDEGSSQNDLSECIWWVATALSKL